MLISPTESQNQTQYDHESNGGEMFHVHKHNNARNVCITCLCSTGVAIKQNCVWVTTAHMQQL